MGLRSLKGKRRVSALAAPGAGNPERKEEKEGVSLPGTKACHYREEVRIIES
jgi:hypothetical protein